MWERCKENPHPYIWLSKEELLRRTVNKKKIIVCQTARTARKQTSRRGPVEKNGELRKERN